jgi:hypothetical protein
VQDLAELYLVVMQHALRVPNKTTPAASTKGWGTMIYSGTSQHAWKPVIERLGDLLYARGEVSKPSAISIEEGILYMFGGNSFLAISEKVKALGFKPKEKGLVESMEAALPAKKV